MPGATQCKARRVAHRRKVGADIDRVRYKEHRHQSKDGGPRKNVAEVFRKAASRHPSDLRADELHRRHQRIGQRHRPEHVCAELRYRLANKWRCRLDRHRPRR